MPDPMPRPPSSLFPTPEDHPGRWDHVDFPAGRDPLTLFVPPNLPGTLVGAAIAGIQGTRAALEFHWHLTGHPNAGTDGGLRELLPFVVTALAGLGVFVWSSYWSRVRFDPGSNTVEKTDIFLGIPAWRRQWSFFDVRAVEMRTFGSGDLPAGGPFDLTADGIRYFERVGCLAFTLYFLRFVPAGLAPYKLYLVLRDRRRILIHSARSRRKAAENGALTARMTRSHLG